MTASPPPSWPPPARTLSAAITFLAIWLLAAATLALRGRGSAVFVGLAVLAGTALFSWFVMLATPTPAIAATPPRRGRLWAQVGWLALVIGITTWSGLQFHKIVAAPMPIWDDAVGAIGSLGVRTLAVDWVGSPYHALANPTAYFALPVIGLLILGARFRSLGFERGQRVLVVIAITAALPVAWIVACVPSSTALVRALLGNTLQNGPFEEFLFRGALQTRLVQLLGVPWALGLQALLFGLWHLGAAAHGGGDLLAAAAYTIVIQGTSGLLFGLVAWRTQNLWAGSVLHVLANSAAELG